MEIYNFSAGPAMLPKEVLLKAQEELLDYQSSGMSIMEMSHRSKLYTGVIEGAESALRRIMNIPDNYKVLFLQGGASSQFSMVPMNLIAKRKSDKIDVIHTGAWTKKAISEAKRYGDVKIVASSEDKTYNYIPEIDETALRKDAAYVHMVTNNTIYGTVSKDVPSVGDIPLVADMSSNILSEEIDVNKYALIFAGAQKNIGPAGLTIVIVRDDLVGETIDKTPIMFDYKTHVDAGSLYNTPPTFSIYVAKLVFEWIEATGGLKERAKINQAKADLLYDYLDNSKLFSATVENKQDRSIMNIPFVTGNDDIDKQFIDGAAANGLVTLKGHRSVGGMRASIYNAMPLEGVKKLVEYMAEFEKNQ